MTTHDSPDNPYTPPRTAVLRRSFVPKSPDEIPFHRRDTFFSLVVAFHLVSILVLWLERTVGWILFLPSVAAIIGLCAIILTGPVYLRDRQGGWWKTGWVDKLAALVIALIYISLSAFLIKELFLALRGFR